LADDHQAMGLLACQNTSKKETVFQTVEKDCILEGKRPAAVWQPQGGSIPEKDGTMITGTIVFAHAVTSFQPSAAWIKLSFSLRQGKK
jgi:hypothetical protein